MLLPSWKKKYNMLNKSTDQVTEKDMRDLLEQLKAPMILLQHTQPTVGK